MSKIISPKITALTFGVLVICFATAFYVVAWQPPTEDPPGGNVPIPLNIGSEAQTKQGSLTINGILTTLQDMIVSLVTIKGDGSISTNLNSDKLDDYDAADLMAGGILSGMIAMFDTNCPEYWTCISCKPGEPLYQRFARGSGTYGGTGGSDTHTHSLDLSAIQTGPGPVEPSLSDEICGGYYESCHKPTYIGAIIYEPWNPFSKHPMSEHTHSLSEETVYSDPGSSLPPYFDVVWCKKD